LKIEIEVYPSFESNSLKMKPPWRCPAILLMYLKISISRHPDKLLKLLMSTEAETIRTFLPGIASEN
jgi:hypothetical protein